MKRLLMLILLASCFCAQAKAPSPHSIAQLFHNYNACFILYDLNQNKIVSEYNPHHRCQERLAPDSTFKIPLSLMAFDQGLISQESRFKWDGKPGALPDWNHDQNPASWLKYSVVWVSQQLSTQLGLEKIKNYLSAFNYGNQDFSGDPGQANGLQYAWLSSSLKISAEEQLNFLKALLNHKLPLSQQAIENTKENLYRGQLSRGVAYYGKTGSGRHGNNERSPHPSLKRDGWFVGFIEHGQQRYIFVSNLSDLKPASQNSQGSLTPPGSALLVPLIEKLLNEYLALKA